MFIILMTGFNVDPKSRMYSKTSFDNGLSMIIFPVSCGHLQNVTHSIFNASIMKKNFSYGDSYEYKCKTGYQLTSDNGTVSCLSDRTFSQYPICTAGKGFLGITLFYVSRTNYNSQQMETRI